MLAIATPPATILKHKRGRHGKPVVASEPQAAPSVPEATGPTSERLKHAGGHYALGDDKQGRRLYTFMDNPLARLYSRLVKEAGADLEQLRREYTALQKYAHHWHRAGQEVRIGSVDLGRTFASDPTSFSGMAKTEQEYSHRAACRLAKEELCLVYGDHEGHRYGIVLDNVMNGWELRDAGGMIGYRSPYRAREIAEKALRNCGRVFQKKWGIG